MKKKITFPAIVSAYGYGWCVALPYNQIKFKTGERVYVSITERRIKGEG